MSMSTESDELCKGALNGEELFTIEGSKNWRSTPKGPKKAQKTHSSPPMLPAARRDELNLRHFPLYARPLLVAA